MINDPDIDMILIAAATAALLIIWGCIVAWAAEGRD